MILLAIGPFALLNLLIRIDNLPLPMLHPSIPLANIFFPIRVSIRSRPFLLTINIITLIRPPILPHRIPPPMKFILFPSSFVLHGGAFIVALTIELVCFPETFVLAAVVVDDQAESLFFVVFEVSCVFVTLCQGGLCAVTVQHVLEEFSLVDKLLVAGYVLADAVEFVLK